MTGEKETITMSQQFRVGSTVQIHASGRWIDAVITRGPWGRSGRNVTVKTIDGQTFTRDISSVQTAMFEPGDGAA